MTSITSNSGQDPLLLPVQIYEESGSACIDTGSKASIAGAQLCQILTKLGCPFEEN